MTSARIGLGCKWPGKANQWCMSHHMAEDLGDGRMHARWTACSVTRRGGLRVGKSVRSTLRPEETEPVKAIDGTGRGRRKRVEVRYVNQRADQFFNRRFLP